MCISREKLKLENMFGRYTYRGSISGYRLVRDQQGRVSESQRKSQILEFLAVCQVIF